MSTNLKRRTKIVEIIDKNGSITIADLLKEIDASTMTIHRDLNALEQEGLLMKTHGGAVSISNRDFIPSFQPRLLMHREEKQAIALEALNFISDYDTLIIDSSTTCLELAKAINNSKFSHLSVITNGHYIISEFLKSPNISVISTGGELRRDFWAYIGTVTINSFQQIPASKAFISSLAVSINYGITEISSDLLYKKAIIEKGQEVILLVDSSKLGKVAPIHIANLSSISKIITDEGISDEYIEKFKETGIEVIIAKVKK